MRYSRFPAAAFAAAVGSMLLSGLPTQSLAQQSPAQTPGAAAPPQADLSILKCNGTRVLDHFKGKLAGPDLPAGLLPIDAKDKSDILTSGLPCQENVSTDAQGTPEGKEDAGLENLQRGFDF